MTNVIQMNQQTPVSTQGKLFRIAAQLSHLRQNPNDPSEFRLRCDVSLYHEGATRPERIVFNCTRRHRELRTLCNQLNTTTLLDQYSAQNTVLNNLVLGHALPVRRGRQYSGYNCIYDHFMAIWADSNSQFTGNLYINGQCYPLNFEEIINPKQLAAGYEYQAVNIVFQRIVKIVDGQAVDCETGEIIEL